MTTTPTPQTAPTLVSLVPASAALGAPDFTLHVLGTGFTETDEILWNGSPEPTTFVSATELTTGVNMATAQVAIEIPVAVQPETGDPTTALIFELREAGTEPPLEELDPPEGFVAVNDPWGRPVLVRAADVSIIEEQVAVSDQAGDLYHKQPATAYRRLTLRSGVQVYMGTKSLSPLVDALMK